jgi:hypothetical protein
MTHVRVRFFSHDRNRRRATEIIVWLWTATTRNIVVIEGDSNGNSSVEVIFDFCVVDGSVPTKTTDEVDWINPLKQYIRQTYDDPEKFAEVDIPGYV